MKNIFFILFLIYFTTFLFYSTKYKIWYKNRIKEDYFIISGKEEGVNYKETKVNIFLSCSYLITDIFDERIINIYSNEINLYL